MRRLFEVNSEPHTGARPSVRLCVGLIKVGIDSRNELLLSLSLSLLFAHFPALRDMHEAPHHVVVLKYPQACDASRLRRLESSYIALLLWGLGLRLRSLALGLVNA